MSQSISSTLPNTSEFHSGEAVPSNGMNMGDSCAADGPSKQPQKKSRALQEKLEQVAIIGFSFLFPETATSEESFWSMMMEKRCVSVPWPSDRIGGDALYHPDPNRCDSVKSLPSCDSI